LQGVVMTATIGNYQLMTRLFQPIQSRKLATYSQ